ncbi:MAG: cytochrome P450, partial [Paracoccaceae bacterium]
MGAEVWANAMVAAAAPASAIAAVTDPTFIFHSPKARGLRMSRGLIIALPLSWLLIRIKRAFPDDPPASASGKAPRRNGMSKAKEIPRPQGHPVIGNLLDIDGKAPIQGFMRMARAFGPIFKVTLGGRDVIWVGSQELVDEVSDEARFDKLIHATLYNIRDFAGDGLFTARTDEPNWGKAHRLLRPAFGPLGMRNMFDQMQDVAEQMMLRWERFGPDTAIDVADNMTRLTLDTIALCAFDYRFNSFYQNEMHPFVDAMVGALGEAGARSRRPQIATRAMMLSERRYRDEIRLMHEVADELIARRRADPDAAGRKDLLSVMLDGRDPQTGERLDDENIRYQMV